VRGTSAGRDATKWGGFRVHFLRISDVSEHPYVRDARLVESRFDGPQRSGSGGLEYVVRLFKPNAYHGSAIAKILPSRTTLTPGDAGPRLRRNRMPLLDWLTPEHGVTCETGREWSRIAYAHSRSHFMFSNIDQILQTESDVEQKLVMPLMTSELLLAIPASSIHTKEYLPPALLDKTAGKSKGYYPDYSVWMHGLPIMIVEAKAPEVPVETGYREASLYARHLNQKYPADFNPCKFILATNGHKIVCGTWDSGPKLTIERQSLSVGTAGLEALQQLCSAAVLEQFAQAASARLRWQHVFLPFDLLGGQPVLNAKLPLNSFAADLSPILRRYFSSTPHENIHEIAERAYVNSNEITEYDRVLESLLKDRLNIRQDTIVKQLAPLRHGETNVSRAIAGFDKDRPEHGQLQIVQGSVGAGKSLFIRRYCDVLQPEVDAKRTRWAFIDFNTSGNLADASGADSWLYQTFAESFQAENPEIDLSSGEVLRGVFSKNIQRRKSIYDGLRQVSPQEAATAKAKDLMIWQDDPKELTRGIANYILGSRREILVTIMDNVDRLDLSSQLNAFQLALSFMNVTKSFVILQMRDETYERFKNQPPLDTYRSGIAFHISPPRFVDVVKRRLELSLEYLTQHAQDVQRYTVESGMRITYPKTELGTFLREVYIELFERRHNISRVLEALAGRDVRRALEMFVSVMISGHLSTTAITSGVLGARTIPIREHSVLKILMRTDYRFASDHSGYTANIFTFSPQWERPSNFINVEILYYLSERRKIKGEIGLEGYFTCRHIADKLQTIGYIPEDVLAACNYLLNRQLITADHFNFRRVCFDDSLKILAAGWLHLRIFSERVEYLYGVIPTTPFTDETAAQSVLRVLRREHSSGDVPAYLKARAVRVFYEYLLREHERFARSSPFPGATSKGSAYVLQKIAHTLAHFRGDPAESEDVDPLDL
jgi:hypothetical protein